jgi:hypothetical protein
MSADAEQFDIAHFNCGHDLHLRPGAFFDLDCKVPNCLGEHERLEFSGVKYDDDKPMMDLIPPHMELEVARVLTVGAKKYSAENWRHVPDLRRRYIAAAKRHINALQQDIMCDDETGLHHAAHAVCCLMFLGEVELEVKTD